MIKEFTSSWHRGEVMTLNTTGLTSLEIEVLIAARNSNYSDVYDSSLEGIGDWSFGVCDATSMTASIYRGVVSSLIKKGYVRVTGVGNEALFKLTNTGISLYGTI